MAALQAATNFPPPEPVPEVSYRSAGRVLVIGPATLASDKAGELAGNVPVTVLVTEGDLPEPEAYAVHAGQVISMEGWLGNFDVHWKTVDGAESQGKFDLVLNLGLERYFRMHQPPQGYFAPMNDTQALQDALREIADAVGEFTKPKFYQLNEKICAHSRSKVEGCNRCWDVCSAWAMRSEGDAVRVESHLCVGCGACATVCPTGAMRYNYPSVSYWGGKLKAVLGAYAVAGGKAACVLVHGENVTLQQDQLLQRVIPVSMFHIASVGLDWLLGALALGANQVVILATGNEAPQYLEALRAQMALGEEILQGLGYAGEHFRLIEGQAGLAHLQQMPPARVPSETARFSLFDDKRTTLEFCIDHFARHAPQPADMIALASGAPFGTVEVTGDKCTLCYSCVSVCPASALLDGDGQQQLNFIERNCVQCGLCETACPEDAIRLVPRLLLAPQAKQKRVLHVDQPFHCVRCGKPFGTRSMVIGMVAKLAGHSMFATPEALNRLRMCGDCRVVDMMTTDSHEVRS
jgi:ferredoxin